MRLRVIDIETSGGAPSEIIEIAAVDVVADGAGGWRAEPPRAQLFRPLGAMSVHAMAVHHLTPRDFPAHMPACDELLLSVFLAEGGRADHLVAHSAAFESSHIGPGATGGLSWICTVKGAKAAWPHAPGHSNQVLRYWRGFELDPAVALPAHRAGPDAWVTAHILMDLLKEMSVEALLAATTAPRRLDRIPFGKHKGQPWAEAPDSYLRWMAAQADMAEDVTARARQELARRAAEGPAEHAA